MVLVRVLVLVLLLLLLLPLVLDRGVLLVRAGAGACRCRCRSSCCCCCWSSVLCLLPLFLLTYEACCGHAFWDDVAHQALTLAAVITGTMSCQG